MKIHCYQCQHGRPKPNSKYRCVVDGWDKQKEVNATDSCERGEENEIYDTISKDKERNVGME